MLKKIITLAIVPAFFLVSCGGGEEKDSDSDSSSEETTSEETEVAMDFPEPIGDCPDASGFDSLVVKVENLISNTEDSRHPLEKFDMNTGTNVQAFLSEDNEDLVIAFTAKESLSAEDICRESFTMKDKLDDGDFVFQIKLSNKEGVGLGEYSQENDYDSMKVFRSILYAETTDKKRIVDGVMTSRDGTVQLVSMNKDEVCGTFTFQGKWESVIGRFKAPLTIEK